MKNRILSISLALVLVVSLMAFAACAGEEEPVAPEEYSLIISAVGEGTTNPTPGTSTETEGDTVSVRAIPNAGYQFDHWEGSVSGTTNPISVKMTSDKSVVAVFVEEVIVEEWEWPKVFKICSSAIGSGDYTELTALAPVLESSTGMKVRVVPENNIPLKSKWIRTGEFDATPQSSGEVAPFCIEAKGGYATRDGGPYQVRGFAQVYVQVFGVMVRGDSPIKTVYDIKPGTRMSVFAVPGGQDVVEAVLAWANLTLDDVELVTTGSYPGQVTMIQEGKADVSCLALPAASFVMEAEAGPHGIRWLDLNAEEDPEGAKRFNSILPCHVLSPMRIGVESAIGHWGWGSPAFLFTRADTDPELIYQLVKWLDENYDSYKDLAPQLDEMSLDVFRQTLNITYLPIHEGAIRYLKEKGMWTEADDVRQAYNVDLVTRYCEAYAAVIDLADGMGIKVDPENEEWIELWEGYKKDIDLPTFKVIYEF